MVNLETLARQYELRFKSNVDYRISVWNELTRHYFQFLVSPDSAVLDLGCGYGEFINSIVAARKYAMDANPECSSRLASGIKFINSDCSTEWPLESASLDLIFTSNLIEHLPSKDHVERTLSEAHRCLKPDGKLICLGPNIRCVPGAYWDFWDHLIPLSERSLKEVLELLNFRIEKCIARFLPFTMSGKVRLPILFVRIYLALPPLWSIFGKQFLVIARK